MLNSWKFTPAAATAFDTRISTAGGHRSAACPHADRDVTGVANTTYAAAAATFKLMRRVAMYLEEEDTPILLVPSTFVSGVTKVATPRNVTLMVGAPIVVTSIWPRAPVWVRRGMRGVVSEITHSGPDVDPDDAGAFVTVQTVRHRLVYPCDKVRVQVVFEHDPDTPISISPCKVPLGSLR